MASNPSKRISAKDILTKYVQTHAQGGARSSKGEGSVLTHSGNSDRDPLSGVTMKNKKEGYFYKRGEFFDSWQKRFFLLIKDKLSYYKTPPQNSSAKPLGTIDLAVVTNVALDVDKSENSFALYTPHRCYMLRTDTLQERTDWVAVITHNWVRTLRSVQKRRITEQHKTQDELDGGEGGGPAAQTSNSNQTVVIDQKIDDDATKEGYIWKIGGDSITGHWQKRWFSLRYSTLTYFKTKKGSTVRGTIDLAKVLSVELDTVKSRQFSWSVVTASRIYFLASDSNDERDGWVFAIREQLQPAPAAGASGAASVVVGKASGLPPSTPSSSSPLSVEQPVLVTKTSLAAPPLRKRATVMDTPISPPPSSSIPNKSTDSPKHRGGGGGGGGSGVRRTSNQSKSKDEDDEEEEEGVVMDEKMVDEILEKQGLFDDALINVEYDSEESDFNVSVHEGFHDFYELGETIGEGGFSKVLQGIHRVTGERFAVKWISKSSLDDLVYLKREISLMKQMDHPNVVKLYEVWEDPDDFLLVMELVSGVEVFEMVTQMGKYSEVHAHHIIKQLIEVMDYLHNTVGIAHRDIKPENILTSGAKGEEILKLIDFGLAKKFGIVKRHRLATRVGTPCYLAPEVVSSTDSVYSQAVDMWSVGVLIYILLSGYHPFIAFDLNIDRYHLEERIKNVQFDFGHPVWNKVSDAAKDLIRRLITRDPKIRYTAQQAKEDPWVKGEVPLASQQLNNTMLRQTSDILKKMKKQTDAFAPPTSLIDKK